LKKATRIIGDLEQLAEVLPRRTLDILDQIATGRFDIHLDHRRLGPSVNRLVLGLICSALFLGSALLLSQQVPPLLFFVPEKDGPTYWLGIKNVSLLGLAGLVASVLLGLRLFWAIVQSGNLEKSD
jgi:ubiquinone biosynthesis protein